MDIIKYLPEEARTSELLNSVVNVYKEIIVDDLNDSIERILKIRDPREIDAEVLDNFLYFIGFFIDTSLFNEDEKRVLTENVKDYYRRSSTKYFINILSMALKTRFGMEELFTKDYITFISKGQAESTGDPDYYPTNHINIEYDMEKFTSEVNLDTVVSIFYNIAPTVLIIYKLLSCIYGGNVILYNAETGIEIITINSTNQIPDFEIIFDAIENKVLTSSQMQIKMHAVQI